MIEKIKEFDRYMGVIAALMPDLLTTFDGISNKVQIVKLTPYGFV